MSQSEKVKIYMQVMRDTLGAGRITAVEQPGAVVLGNFDGIHQGHRALLRAASEIAERCGWRRRVLTFSPHPRAQLGDEQFKLIYDEQQKTEIMRETGLVDELVFLSFDKALQTMPAEAFFEQVLCQRYLAKAVIVGENFHFGYRGQGDAALLRRLCESRGMLCQTLRRVTDGGAAISSSRIRMLLKKGEVEEAGRLLGRPYFIEGTVSHGKRLGTRLHTPTINILMSEERLAPKKGVYVSYTRARGEGFPSISNVGHNPTVGGESLRTETHLLDFSGDLYGEAVQVELLTFLRPERQFESVEALQTQLLTDIAKAKDFFIGGSHEEI